MSEYMPIDAYALLRRVVLNGPQRTNGDSIDDDAAKRFLISRGFAELDESGTKLKATQAGKDFGRIMRKGP